MKNLFKLLGLFLFFSLQQNVFAQKNTNDNIIDPKMDIEEYLPTLDSLYEIGLRNNPLVRLEMAQSELLKKESLKIALIKIEVEKYNYKKEVADCYTNLIGAQKIFKVRNEDLFVQKIACDVAEKEYREGIIKISEYARQRNAMTNSIAAQEDAKRDYINYFEKLQVILGVKFNKIKR
jgi:hypothetical protein